MNQEPERLLESDRLEEVLEESGPPQPVVVVQYRTRTVPWLFIIVLAIVLGLGCLFVYHRREVDRLSAQALEARRDLERLEAMKQAEENASEPRKAGPPATAAMDPRPSDAPGAQPVTASAGDGSSAATQAPATTGDAKPTDPANPPEPAKADPAMALTQLPGNADPPPASGTGPTAPAGPTASVAPSPGKPPDPSTPVITAAKVPDSASPFDEPPGAVAERRPEDPAADAPVAAATPVAAPAAAGPQGTAGPAGQVAAPVEPPLPPNDEIDRPIRNAVDPPLPSKEETERQIREEAAKLQAEDDQRLSQQQQDLRALKEEDRTRFRAELRTILETYGDRAGKEIEALSVRAGRDEDPVRRARAYRVIGTGPSSQRTKVRQLRALGMPEAVILDFLANGLNLELGTRNGPRSRNQVWVLAARLLLKYEPTPPRQGPADGRGAGDGRGHGKLTTSMAVRKPAGATTPRTP